MKNFIDVKQVCDLISLSVLAIMDKKDNTICNPNPEDLLYHEQSPVSVEIVKILNCDKITADKINAHIAAIRIGYKMGREEMKF